MDFKSYQLKVMRGSWSSLHLMLVVGYNCGRFRFPICPTWLFVIPSLSLINEIEGKSYSRMGQLKGVLGARVLPFIVLIDIHSSTDCIVRYILRVVNCGRTALLPIWLESQANFLKVRMTRRVDWCQRGLIFPCDNIIINTCWVQPPSPSK